MGKHNPETTFRQLLVHAREAVEISRDKTRADLDDDRLLNLASTRLIEIIVEAAKRVPASVQPQYLENPLSNDEISRYD